MNQLETVTLWNPESKLHEKSKKQIQAEVTELIGALIESGFGDPVSYFTKAKIHHEATKMILADPKLKEAVIDQVDQYHGEMKWKVATLKVKNMSAELNYSDDEEWRNLQGQIENLTFLRKQREEQLKRAFQNDDAQSDIDGQLIDKISIRKERSRTLEVKF